MTAGITSRAQRTTSHYVIYKRDRESDVLIPGIAIIIREKAT